MTKITQNQTTTATPIAAQADTNAKQNNSLAKHCKLSWLHAWREIFCTRQQWHVTLLIWLVTLTLLCICSTRAFAANGALPYEEWLSILQQSLTGPVAFSVSLIGIVTCGATLILSGGEISHFMRSLIYIVLVMTLLVGANSLMHNFFQGSANTASIDYNQPQYQLHPEQSMTKPLPSSTDYFNHMHSKQEHSNFLDLESAHNNNNMMLAAATSSAASNTITTNYTSYEINSNNMHSVFEPLSTTNNENALYYESLFAPHFATSSAVVTIEMTTQDLMFLLNQVASSDIDPQLISSVTTNNAYDPLNSPYSQNDSSFTHCNAMDTISQAEQWQDLNRTARSFKHWHEYFNNAEHSQLKTPTQPHTQQLATRDYSTSKYDFNHKLNAWAYSSMIA